MQKQNQCEIQIRSLIRLKKILKQEKNPYIKWLEEDIEELKQITNYKNTLGGIHE